MLNKLQEVRSRIIAAAFNIGVIADEIGPNVFTSGSPSKHDRLLAIQQELGDLSRALDLYAALDWRDAREELPFHGEKTLTCGTDGVVSLAEFFICPGDFWWQPSGNPILRDVRFWARVHNPVFGGSIDG